MKQLSPLLIDFLRLLDNHGIAHCAMGHSHVDRSDPGDAAVDTEIIVTQRLAPQLPILLADFCRTRRARLVSCTRNEHNLYHCIIALASERGRPDFLSIGIRGDFYSNYRLLIGAEEILQCARPAIDLHGKSRGYSIGAPVHEFCRYLVRCIIEQELTGHDGQHLTRQCRLDPHGVEDLVERLWGRSLESKLLTRAAHSGDWSAVAKLLPRMLTALHRRARVSMQSVFSGVRQRWQNWLRPPGLLIAVVGVSGSGKSSVIAAVDRRIQQAFRRTAIVHLRPGFLYPPERSLDRGLQPERTRGSWQSLARLLTFAADYRLGYQLSLRRMLTHRDGLLFDRYYDDLLADPIRYRYGGSQQFARKLRAIAPRPDLWILLDAPTEVLQSRKQTHSRDESERQRLAYRDVLKDQRNVVIIDASPALGQVVSQVTDVVLEHCESKTRAALSAASFEVGSHGSVLPIVSEQMYTGTAARMLSAIANQDATVKSDSALASEVAEAGANTVGVRSASTPLARAANP